MKSLKTEKVASDVYLKNAREILKKARKEGDVYVDVKYVQEACGVAYLGVLKAIDEYLVSKGVPQKNLPKSVEAYREALRRYLGSRNGKLLSSFERIYEELHIAGYYRGFLRGVSTVNEAIKAAEDFVNKLKKLT